MPRFAANISMMFAELDFFDRFEAAARAGFKGVEFLFPYEHPKDRLVEALQRNGLTQVLHNLPPGDWPAGERGLACLPGREGEFQDAVGRAIDYATALGCPQLHCMAGIPPRDADPQHVRRVLVENLRLASAQFKRAGIKLLVEMINTRDMPGFYLNHTAQALDLLDEVGSDNAFLQYDCYHMQIMEGDLTPTIERHLDRIAHIQIADTPGRHEPGTGEINYPFVFAALDRMGYPGWVSGEYRPAGRTEDGLGWFAPYAGRSAQGGQ